MVMVIPDPENGRMAFSMHELLWKMFSQTGNVDMYLLMKELEESSEDVCAEINEATSLDSPSF